MKKKVGIFIFLLFLFSACSTPAATETVTQVQSTQTPGPIISLTPALRPTSTFNVSNQEAINRGESRFCQVGPESTPSGSTVNVSVFGLPPNDNVSIYVFLYEEFAKTFMTNDNGYVNADIIIPMNAPLEWNRVVVIGTDATVECFVWVWSEGYLPTYYAGLTKTLTPTLSPEQVVMTATQQALKDTLGANCYYGSAQGIRLSPDGQWAEAICDPYSIVIGRMDGTKEWSVSSDSLIAPYTDHFVHVAHWSNDGAYVYIYVNPHTDGYWESFHQGMVLYRLKLETGEISEVLPLGKSDRIYYSFSFSPDDRRLAYIETDQSPVILNIRDMQTGIEQSFQFDSKYNTGGGFVWSSDSQKLVFSIRQFDTNTYDQVGTSVVLWEQEKSKTLILIKDYEENLLPIEWVNDTKLVLQVEYEDDKKFEFDLMSNELKQISP